MTLRLFLLSRSPVRTEDPILLAQVLNHSLLSIDPA